MIPDRGIKGSLRCQISREICKAGNPRYSVCCPRPWVGTLPTWSVCASFAALPAAYLLFVYFSPGCRGESKAFLPSTRVPSGPLLSRRPLAPAKPGTPSIAFLGYTFDASAGTLSCALRLASHFFLFIFYLQSWRAGWRNMRTRGSPSTMGRRRINIAKAHA